MEHSEDRFLELCRADLWEELKGAMPEDSITEEAARLLVKEVSEFHSKYPLLRGSKKVRHQLVRNVIERVALTHPGLRLTPFQEPTA